MHLHLSRRGISLIEAMLAIMVLAIALSGVMSQLASHHAARLRAHEQAVARGLVQTLADRLAGARWEDLRTTAAPWSLGRYDDGSRPVTADRSEAMTETSTDARDCLLMTLADGSAALGILARPSGLDALSVRLAWYRAADHDANGDGAIATSERGLLDAGLADRSAWIAALPGYVLTSVPGALTDPDLPVLVRISVTWTGGDGAPATFSLISVRRR